MNKLKQLVILGGGHAGSSAALAAANHLAQLMKENEFVITLVDKSSNLTIRPRLYEYELEKTQVALKSFLEPIGVKVLTSEVRDIDIQKQEILLNDQKISYDALIVALGSQLIQTSVPGLEHSYNIDTFAAASQFRKALVHNLLTNNKPCRIAILGAGITGLELATELPLTVRKIAQEYKRDVPNPTIYLLDRHVATRNAGLSIEEVVKKALEMAQVECINQASINKIEDQRIIYNGTEFLEVDLIVSTLGLKANNITNHFPFSKDQQGRVNVNQYLQVQEQKNCFFAGDIAHAYPAPEHASIMSCQQGRPQGRYAGYNAVSFLLNEPLVIYSQPNYVTCIDLGEFGAVYTEGWERSLAKSGLDAKKIKQHINQDRIYPPNSTDKRVLLNAGYLEFISPTSSIKKEN